MLDLKFTRTHEWLRCNGTEVTVGITDHAQELLGDMVFVDLPEIDKTIKAGAECGVVESVKAASDVYSPITGIVTAVNNQVKDNPALVNTDPYGEGWLIKLKATNPAEIDLLLDYTQYQTVIAEDH